MHEIGVNKVQNAPIKGAVDKEDQSFPFSYYSSFFFLRISLYLSSFPQNASLTFLSISANSPNWHF